jgi:hypothetical protein
MSDYWAEFHRRVEQWQDAGDTQRLELAEQYVAACEFRETEPERQLEMFTRARDQARRLKEPWWVLFFETWRLSTLTADLHDFARAMPLAMELMVRFNSPEGQAHSCHSTILTNVLYTYLQVDPIGYRDELERGFAYQDGQISKSPVVERFVLDYRWTEYFRETDRWEEAFDRAHQSLAMADQSGDESKRNWHGTWSLFILCEICDALGRLEQLAAHAQDMAERSESRSSLRRTRAAAYIWLAVVQRARGDEKAGSRAFHRGMRQLKDVDARDEICADAVAKYYEVGGDFNEAVGVRDRELAVITKKGMLHRACRAQLERCRLLSLAGALTADDLDRVREAANKLRTPDWHLEKLRRFEASLPH